MTRSSGSRIAFKRIADEARLNADALVRRWLPDGSREGAEWVALNYSHRGVRVACLCPNVVNTGMIGRNEDDEAASHPVDADLVARIGNVIEPEEAAAAALDEGRFLALPHPRVGESYARKAQDYDAWLDRTAGRLRRMRGEV